MAAIDFSQFHELAEQLRGEIPLKELCAKEGIRYHGYLRWRKRMGIAPRVQRKRQTVPSSTMVEVVTEDVPTAGEPSPKATEVRIVFENGLTFDRREMDVDALVEFLTKIRAALCLG